MGPEIREEILGEGELEENIVQTAVLKRWRQKLSVTLQKGNTAIFRACMGCQVTRGTPSHLTKSSYRGLDAPRPFCRFLCAFLPSAVRRSPFPLDTFATALS